MVQDLFCFSKADKRTFEKPTTIRELGRAEAGGVVHVMRLYGSGIPPP